MKLPILIGISGAKRAGKGTVAKFIAEWAQSQSPALSALDRGFADKMKWAFARQFFPGISMEDAIAWCDEFKERGYLKIGPKGPLFRRSGPDADWDTDPLIHHVFDGREPMANFGIDMGRDLFGNDFWVNELLPPPRYTEKIFGVASDARPSWANEWGEADICTISDMRFDEELQAVDFFEGFTIKVRNIKAEHQVIFEAQKRGKPIHRSEIGFDDGKMDFIIRNNDSLDHLHASVFGVMEDIKRELS
jgi:hypothetical protein